MSRSRIMTLVTVGSLTLGGAFFVGCGGGGEEQGLIRSFFQASRFGDRTTLGSMAMVGFSPDTDGIVSGVSVQSVAEEQRRPLQIVSLGEAVAEAQAKELVFRA